VKKMMEDGGRRKNESANAALSESFSLFSFHAHADTLIGPGWSAILSPGARSPAAAAERREREIAEMEASPSVSLQDGTHLATALDVGVGDGRPYTLGSRAWLTTVFLSKCVYWEVEEEKPRRVRAAHLKNAKKNFLTRSPHALSLSLSSQFPQPPAPDGGGGRRPGGSYRNGLANAWARWRWAARKREGSGARARPRRPPPPGGAP
jgi:hypothetical protein